MARLPRIVEEDSEWARNQFEDETPREKVNALINSFLWMEKITNGNDAFELYRVLHAAKNFNARLKKLKRPIAPDDVLVNVTVSKLDSVTRNDWEKWLGRSREPATFDQLMTFLEDRKSKLLASSDNKSRHSSTDMLEYVTSSMESSMVLPASSRNKPRNEQLSMCVNTTKANEVWTREKLRKKFFHETPLPENCSEASSSSDNMGSFEDQYLFKYKNQPSFLVNDAVSLESIILSTAVVKVITKDRQVMRVRALIEKLSPCSLISNRLANALPHPFTTSISNINRRYSYSKGATECTKIRVMSCHNSTSFDVKVFILQDEITSHRPRIVQSTTDWPHLSNLKLADDGSEDWFFNKDCIDLLLGADACEKILQQNVIQTSQPNEPIAQQTSLGWILSGTCCTEIKN